MDTSGTLHQNHLYSFTSFMEAIGYKAVKPKSFFEVIRFELAGDVVIIFTKSKKRQHLSIQNKDVWLVKGYMNKLKEYKQQQLRAKIVDSEK